VTVLPSPFRVTGKKYRLVSSGNGVKFEVSDFSLSGYIRDTDIKNMEAVRHLTKRTMTITGLPRCVRTAELLPI